MTSPTAVECIWAPAVRSVNPDRIDVLEGCGSVLVDVLDEREAYDTAFVIPGQGQQHVDVVSFDFFGPSLTYRLTDMAFGCWQPGCVLLGFGAVRTFR
jgi:hypothetical protein